MPEIGLDRADVVAIVGKLVAAGMAQLRFGIARAVIADGVCVNECQHVMILGLSKVASLYGDPTSALFGCVRRKRSSRRVSTLWARCLISQASRLMALACGLSSIVSLMRASASANS